MKREQPRLSLFALSIHLRLNSLSPRLEEKRWRGKEGGGGQRKERESEQENLSRSHLRPRTMWHSRSPGHSLHRDASPKVNKNVTSNVIRLSSYVCLPQVLDG